MSRHDGIVLSGIIRDFFAGAEQRNKPSGPIPVQICTDAPRANLVQFNNVVHENSKNYIFIVTPCVLSSHSIITPTNALI